MRRIAETKTAVVLSCFDMNTFACMYVYGFVKLTFVK